MGVAEDQCWSIADPTPLFKEQLTLLPQNDIGGGRWCDERGAEEKVE